MRLSARCGICLLSLLTWSVVAVAEPTKDEIARAVKQLGDDDFAVRQKATQLLWEAGAAAEAALKEAAKSPDAEVSVRAAALLDKLRWGVRHDTPKEVVDLIHAYRAAVDDGGREKALRGLLTKGNNGLVGVIKIWTAESNPEAKEAVKRIAGEHRAASLPALLAEDKFDALEDLLAFTAHTHYPQAMQDYVALLSLRGRLGAKIKELEPQADDVDTARVLAYLCRANGDTAKAVKHATTSGDPEPLETLLFLNRDWAALAERLARRESDDVDEAVLGMLLTCHVRGGKKDAVAKAVAALKEWAEKTPETDGTSWWASKPLFFNDMPDEALGVLERSRTYPIMLDVLTAQARYREALALAEKVAASGEKASLGAGVRRARLLHELGDRKKAGAVLDDLLKVDPGKGEEWEWRELLALLNEVGRRDEAFDLHVRRITDDEGWAGNPWVWSALFPPERGQQAWVWWTFLRSQDPRRKLTVAEVVKTVRQFVEVKADGKPSPERLADAIAWARLAKPEESEPRLKGLAEWCRDMKLPDRERDCLRADAEAQDKPWVWQRLGEHDAGLKKWKEAAESFRKAWDKDQTKAVPLWLLGWALEQGGDAKEGARLRDRARWLALGDLDDRYALSEVMEKHGHREDSRRELALLHRLCPADGAYLGDALDAAEEAALEKGDHLAAADAAELSMLGMMTSGATYLHDRSWVTEPGRIHLLRGRGLLVAGKVDEALAEARACLKLLPGDIDVPIHFVPSLRKLGRAREADALLDDVRGVYTDLMRDYPDWGGGHNALAWLDARLRTNLDEALTHARKAVQLRPDETAFLDTLAEVHFQKGDKDKAVELVKRCLQREPDSDFYRKQLKRYEAGDPKADVPDA